MICALIVSFYSQKKWTMWKGDGESDRHTDIRADGHEQPLRQYNRWFVNCLFHFPHKKVGRCQNGTTRQTGNTMTERNIIYIQWIVNETRLNKLTIDQQERHKWPVICSTCHKHFPVFSAFMAYHPVYMTGATSGVGTVNRSGACAFTGSV